MSSREPVQWEAEGLGARGSVIIPHLVVEKLLCTRQSMKAAGPKEENLSQAHKLESQSG